MKVPRKYLILIILFLPLWGLCSTNAYAVKRSEKKSISPPQIPAPALLPGTRSDMNSPGFWIGRHPFPNKIILDERKIQTLNEAIRNELKISYDLTAFPDHYPGESLIAALNQDYVTISGIRLYRCGGESVTKSLLSSIKLNMNVESIPSRIFVKFGFITRYADLRVLPVTEGFYQARVIRDFDRLQNSALDVATAVAILHTSYDGKWHYVIASHGEGWVEAGRVIPCEFDEMKKFVSEKDFVVVTSSKGELYLDSEMTEFYERVRMGQRFPLIQEHADKMEVILPERDPRGSIRFISVFVRKKDVSRGFLPYTPRNIIVQAFEFLNDPYGWGDMNGDQDCSSFIRGIFATVGLELPRNSFFQSRIGHPLESFDGKAPPEQKKEILSSSGIGGITLLRMAGHIMLYLGSVDGVPFAIHGIYGYHDVVNNKEYVKVVNRIIVSDLDLGKSTRVGSFINRIDRIRIVE